MNYSPGSRYYGTTTYTVTLPNGVTVTAIPPAVPNPVPPVGFHRCTSGDRLDLIAVMYLNAPTGFWRLCDTNNSMVAASLAARPLIAIPRTGQR
jgi:hypothetical protein